MNATTKVKVLDFGTIIIIKFEGEAIVSMKRVGRGWEATDGRTSVYGAKAKVLKWAKYQAKYQAEEIKARCGGGVY